MASNLPMLASSSDAMTLTYMAQDGDTNMLFLDGFEWQEQFKIRRAQFVSVTFYKNLSRQTTLPRHISVSKHALWIYITEAISSSKYILLVVALLYKLPCWSWSIESCTDRYASPPPRCSIRSLALQNIFVTTVPLSYRGRFSLLLSSSLNGNAFVRRFSRRQLPPALRWLRSWWFALIIKL